jgi:hypothetical protein
VVSSTLRPLNLHGKKDQQPMHRWMVDARAGLHGFEERKSSSPAGNRTLECSSPSQNNIYLGLPQYFLFVKKTSAVCFSYTFIKFVRICGPAAFGGPADDKQCSRSKCHRVIHTCECVFLSLSLSLSPSHARTQFYSNYHEHQLINTPESISK